MIILTDQGKVGKLEEKIGDNIFNTHALSEEKGFVDSHLVMFKMGKFYKLVGSDEGESSVAFDSEFHIFKGHETVLGINEEGVKVDE